MQDLTVLVVDDDFRVAEAHARIVRGIEGFTVIGIAHSAKEALDAIEQGHPDLLLLDIHLPDATGIHLLREARKVHFDLDVIVISAVQDGPIIQDAMRGGIVGYVAKPFRIEELRARILDYARRTRALSSSDRVRQWDIDMMTGASPTEARPVSGVNPETADEVVQLVRDAGPEGTHAESVADALGVSRVTARKYLEWLVEIGRVDVRSDYGSRGRPRRRYQLRATK